MAHQGSAPSRHSEQGGSTPVIGSPWSSDGLVGLVGVMMLAVRRGYAGVTTPFKDQALLADSIVSNMEDKTVYDTSTAQGENYCTESERREAGCKEEICNVRGGKGALLVPGCAQGFGGGMVDMCLADQCASLLRELYINPSWKELIARTILGTIRSACSLVSKSTVSKSPMDSGIAATSEVQDSGPSKKSNEEVLANAAAALAIISGSSGVLYPGTAVRSTSGAVGRVVQFSPGDAEAGVVFSGETIEGYEMVPTQDLEAVDVGMQSDPDTPAQPIVSQLIALVSSLLTWGVEEFSHGRIKRGIPGEVGKGHTGMGSSSIALSRLLSQSLAALQQLSIHCSEAVVAACQEGEVMVGMLPKLLQVATEVVPLPSLLTVKDMEDRWRSAQVRGLSAFHLGPYGLRSLQPVQRCPLPPLKNKKDTLGLSSPSGKGNPIHSEPHENSYPREGHGRGHDEATSARDAREIHSRRGHLRGHNGQTGANRGNFTIRERVERVERGGQGWLQGRRRRLDFLVTSGSSVSSSNWAMVGEDQDAPDGGQRPGTFNRQSGARARPGFQRMIASLSDRTRVLLQSSQPRTHYLGEQESIGISSSVEPNRRVSDMSIRNIPRDYLERGVEGCAESVSSREGDVEVRKEQLLFVIVGYYCTLFTGMISSGPTAVDCDGGEVGSKVKEDGCQTMTIETGARHGLARPKTTVQASPVSHILEYSAAAIARREADAEMLATELSTLNSVALTTLEVFGNVTQARQWLKDNKDQVIVTETGTMAETETEAQEGQVEGDRSCNERTIGDPNWTEGRDRALSPSVPDTEVVASLIGSVGGPATSLATSDTASDNSAHCVSVEALNQLWDRDEDSGETCVQDTSELAKCVVKCVAPLCQHDLEPILVVPTAQPSTGRVRLGMSSSSLRNEADLLLPGSLVFLSTGEGYAPETVGASATISVSTLAQQAQHLLTNMETDSPDRVSAINNNRKHPAQSEARDGGGEGYSHVVDVAKDGGRPESGCEATGRQYQGLVMEGEEVLVDILDHETGMCLAKQVPVADLRCSRSLYGEKLDTEGTALAKVLWSTDMTLSVLRARCLLVHLIHNLHMPAVAAAGGPQSLLRLTRLLAAQEMATGTAPAPVWGKGSDNGHSSEDTRNDTRNDLPVDARTSQDSLLKVLWHKVMESDEQNSEVGAMLAQEVLDSFEALSAPPKTMICGGWDRPDPGVIGQTVDAQTEDAGMRHCNTSQSIGTGKIVHESLHPVCAPLSYAGHLKMNPSCHGMVIKMDSHSCTPSSLLCLKFFLSREDMILNQNPLRTMHGHNMEHSFHALNKGLEFFKIEEASSLSSGMSNVFGKNTLSFLENLDMPADLIHQTSEESSLANLSSISSVSPSSTESTHQAVIISRAFARALVKKRNQQNLVTPIGVSGTELETLNTDFRSFSLPGVTDLWFRFDAPPGADRPPVRMVVLAGKPHYPPSLRVPATILFQATGPQSGVPVPDADMETVEDQIQEDLGLNNLFDESYSDDPAADPRESSECLPLEAVGTGLDVGQVPKGEEDEVGDCLVSAEGVHLSSGKWYYEATIVSLDRSSSSSSSQGGLGLLRVGWASCRLSSNTLSKPVHAGGNRCQGIESPKGQGSEEAMQVKGREAVLPTQTVVKLWEDEDDERSHNTDEDHVVADETKSASGELSVLEVTTVSRSQSAPGILKRDRGGHAHLHEDVTGAEQYAQNISFAVLGSDQDALGWGLGEEGFLWSRNKVAYSVSRRLAATDVVGCALDLDSGSFRFSVNGKWSEPTDKGTISTITEDHRQELFCPCFSLRGGTSVSINFGATPFAFPLPTNAFKPVVLREVSILQNNPERFGQGNFMEEASTSTSKKPVDAVTSGTPVLRPKHVTWEGTDSDWGFRFVAEPLVGVQYRVVRDLELVCKLGAEDSSGASGVLTIWRPRVPDGWFSVGDVASLGSRLPSGAVVVRGDSTGCDISKPAKFRVVYQDKASGYNIWRPVPKQGQVSLGDFACAKKANKVGAMAGAVRCVATWAVEPCPVLQCMRREGSPTEAQSIWSVHNGLGTFFGSQTGGRLGRWDVSRGLSREERRRKKKKKKKKKPGHGDISEDEENESIKFRHGIGQGWALRGVRSSCISNEWCQEGDVAHHSTIPSPHPTHSHDLIHTINAEGRDTPGSTNLHKGQHALKFRPGSRVVTGGLGGLYQRAETKAGPSVTWASWLLSFLLDQPSLRQLAMQSCVFETLVSYLFLSVGAPHRIRLVPLLTQLVRSHGDFEGGHPPLERLSGFLRAVLGECDKRCLKRNTDGTDDGGQALLRWAPKGLLLLTDLATATQNVKDNLEQKSLQRKSLKKGHSKTQGNVAASEEGGRASVGDDGADPQQDETQDDQGMETTEPPVHVLLPPFGSWDDQEVASARDDDGQGEKGDEDRSRMSSRSGEISFSIDGAVPISLMDAEDRGLLENDLRHAKQLETTDFSKYMDTGHASGESQEGKREGGDTEHRIVSSTCLHHLMEVIYTLGVLQGTWPSSLKEAEEGLSHRSRHLWQGASLYLDSLLCEAWIDAVGRAMVRESAHPLQTGLVEETLHFPGARQIVVFLDPRSSMPKKRYALTFIGTDKNFSVSGRNESDWDSVVTFRGDTISYRFSTNTEEEGRPKGSLVEDLVTDDWGYRFTAVAEGPLWEKARLESNHPYNTHTDRTGIYQEFSVPGALSLLLEFDRECSMPEGHNLIVYRISDQGTPVQVCLLSDCTSSRPVYVKGDTVRLMPTKSKAGFVPVENRQSSILDTSSTLVEGRTRAFVSSGIDLDLVAGSKCDSLSKGNEKGALPLERAYSAPVSLYCKENDSMPVADTKLERLPSGTPVLSIGGRAAGLERRFTESRTFAHEVHEVHATPDIDGASFASSSGAIEIADSDAESKDNSNTNSPASSTLWVGDWGLESLSETLALGAPALLSTDSGFSDSAPPGDVRGGERVSGQTNNLGGMSMLEIDGLSESDVLRPRAMAAASSSSRTSDEEKGPLPQSFMHKEDREDREEQQQKDKQSVGGVGKVEDVEHWGWGCTVRTGAMTRGARLHLYLKRQQSLPSPPPSLEDVRTMMRTWTHEMDADLLELLGVTGATTPQKSDNSSNLVHGLNPWICRLSRAEAQFQQQRLADVPAHSIQIRAALLLKLNQRIQWVLPVIDLASRQVDSLGWQVREMNHVILPHVKGAILEAALQLTQGNGGDCVCVTLDNVKAMTSRDKEEKDLTSSQCVFVQAYHQLHNKDPQLLRNVWDGGRVFQVTFVGEEGVDAGGVFREGVSRMVEDLFSPNFNLLIQCPNGRQATGQNNEKYVPNPQHTSPLALNMLHFVGRLMGVSMRTRLCLPFQLPGMIWKRLLGLHIGFDDLVMVDTITCQFLTAIRDCEDDGLTSEVEFADKYGERLFFTCTGSDGVERDLAPGGSTHRVTFHNRYTFCDMVEHARLHEFDAQVAAIAQGLSEIVPMKVLRLFTAKQLEIAVAGEPVFNIDLWKKHTEYRGFRADDPTIVLMWKVLASFTPEEQSGFVRFAWGRSRLPPEAHWQTNMKISNCGKAALPVSHTCFFSVELPEYRTKEEMRKGLLTAIHFGMGGILNA
ncbi:unnamed protein product [Choristocarpus tenellus]